MRYRVPCRILPLILTVSSVVRADGFTPEEARARMKLPDGFRARVFASEPDIRQPVAACFDERGRLWVVEYLQYPNPAGLKPVSVDVYLRTEYDRVPEPPPHGPRGADRIKILEDTDGDGTADKVTTFVEGLNLASAIAVGHGGVFVGQAPYLLFYPDRNRDDLPDGDPEVLLSGFGLQDAHATVNSLAWGPDGWLYGAQGSTVTARIRGVEFQQGIWRYHPQTRQFELFAEGGGNTWGLDFDRAGNAFGSSNGGFICFHMVQGGYYWKGFAKHGPLHNPRTYGYFDAIAYAGPKAGGHVTPGGILYKGDQFPEPFQGAFLGGNLLANAVYWHALSPLGSTFQGRHAGTLIDAQDTWFRPIDLLTGPDGSLYVVDWYDRRASHLDPRDNWDKSNGRIYRISYGDPRPIPKFDLAALSSRELVELRSKANDWWPDMARRLLAERRDGSVASVLKSYLASGRDEPAALRDLWALYVSGGLDDAIARSLLNHPLPGVRRWTIRLLGDEHRMDDRFRDQLIALAAHEPDATVRSQLASSCQRWKAEDALPIVARLLGRSEDLSDPHIPLLLWWALERQLHDDCKAVIELVVRPEAQKRPLVRQVILERLARALVERGQPDDFAACARLLAAAPSGLESDRLVAGMEKGLEGRRLEQVPAALTGAVAAWSRAARPDPTRLRLAVRLGSTEAYARLLGLARENSLGASERQAVIELLGQARAPEGLATLLALLDPPSSPPLQLTALSALGGYDEPAVAPAVLARIPAFPETVRDRALDLLCGRKTWAAALLDALEQARLPAQAVRPAHALKLSVLDDPALLGRLEKVWGRVPGPGSEEKLRRIAEVRGTLVEGDKGNAARGRPIFQQHCAGCHKLFDEGEAIGPDLTGAERNNLDFLLTSLVDPSALVRKEYQSQTVALEDGRILTGLVLEESDSAITLIDSQRQKTVVPKTDIAERKPAATSLMPEGLLDPLPDDQLRDLFRYLQSSRPPAAR